MIILTLKQFVQGHITGKVKVGSNSRSSDFKYWYFSITREDHKVKGKGVKYFQIDPTIPGLSPTLCYRKTLTYSENNWHHWQDRESGKQMGFLSDLLHTLMFTVNGKKACPSFPLFHYPWPYLLVSFLPPLSDSRKTLRLFQDLE